MKEKLILHDYANCISNLGDAVLNHFGVASDGKPLSLAKPYLNKRYKNIVVLLLDGLGTCILDKNLEDNSFFKKHLVDSYKTVFPSTTVAATTSIMSGLQPIEHAWLGWDCYYPQVDKNVTVFLNTEQGTDKQVSEENVAWKYCGYESIVDKINASGKKAYHVTPFVPPHPDSFAVICKQIQSLCNEEGEKYIYAYWNEPDSTMHEYGCYSKETKSVIVDLEAEVEKLYNTLEDTLLIVTADHGHIDGRNVSITDYPGIMECLVRMPSIEPRALNLYIKEGKKEQFEREFTKEFGEDFILLTKAEVYDNKLFGTGVPHQNVDDMIGDYLAIGVTDLTIFNTEEEANIYKGVHAGYTKEEMLIPFIVIET